MSKSNSIGTASSAAKDRGARTQVVGSSSHDSANTSYCARAIGAVAVVTTRVRVTSARFT